MTASPPSEVRLAGRAWQLMFDYLVASSPKRQRSLEMRGLTPNDARALWSLDDKDARPIGTLARDWKCDPSNATFIIKRLEKAGLVERRSGVEDRRVKLVLLTPLGVSTRNELLAEHRTPPVGFADLSPSDLRTLIALIEKLPKPIE